MHLFKHHDKGPTIGTLYLNIKEGNFKHDEDFITKMDPYCMVTYNGEKYKTSTVKSGGKHPTWN